MARNEHHRLYDTKAWKQLRAEYLAQHGRCEDISGCKAVPTIVDHRIPHKGDETLFFDWNNLQALCKPHHDGAKQQKERSGTERGCDATGAPLDPSHPWNETKVIDLAQRRGTGK